LAPRSFLTRWTVAWVLSGAACLPVPSAIAGNGDPIGGLPSYFERAALALTNACRQGPQTYRDTYLSAYPTILQPGNHPPQRPLYWNLALSQAARAHSVDMATNGCFGHSSCDGTPWNSRVASYYSESGAIAENVAAGQTSPFAAVNSWLIDGGAADLTPLAGHRTNIMHAAFREMGNGYAFNAAAPYDHYWTQDFGGGAADFSTPLAWGSHVFTGDGNITFLANYYSSAGNAPQEAVLVLESGSYPMSLQFGVAGRGTYSVALPIGSGCRGYSFRFRDDVGTVWLHPENGVLRTTGEGGCAEEYVPGSAGVSLPTPGALELDVSPNPALTATTIRFRTPGPSPATVRILDLSGRRVREATFGDAGGGATWAWDGRDGGGRRVEAGIYFVRADAGGWHSTRRVVWLGGAR
jgi:hypothetical protein